MRAGGATFGLIRCAPILSPSLSILTVVPGGTFETGFKPSWYVTGYGAEDYPQRLVRVRILVSCMPLRGSHRFLTQSAYESEFDTPHMIAAYTAPNTPAILRDEFMRLDRRGLVMFLRSSQREDGRLFSLLLRSPGPTKRKSPPQTQREVTRIYTWLIVCSLRARCSVVSWLEFVRRCPISSTGTGASPTT